MLDKYNIPRRSLKMMCTKYRVNHNYFNKVDSSEKAYWLGFIYADGYVTSDHKVGIALGIKDREHLEKFRSAVKSTHPIKVYTSSHGYADNTQYARILFSSEQMTSDLIKLGCFEHKSLILTFPTEEQVPTDFLRDFVRGYIDGDGSITSGGKYQPLVIRVCGTFELLTGLKNYFNTLLFPAYVSDKFEKRHKDSKNNYSLSISSKTKALAILDELYNDASVYLDRKYTTYIERKNLLNIA